MVSKIEKFLRKCVRILERRSVRMPLIAVLLVYSAAVAPRLSAEVNEVMNNMFVRLFVLLAVVLLAHQDIVLALLLLIAYIMSSVNMREYFDNDDDDNKADDDDDKSNDDSDESTPSTPAELDEKQINEGESKPLTADADESSNDAEVENFENNSNCLPEGYNASYNCFDNTGDVSPCAPCGTVGAFDNEMTAQGLKSIVGYPGNEFSNF